MIPEPGDVNLDVNVTETFHLQTDDELFDKELKQIEADDQAIHTILLGLPEDIYAAVDSCETAQEIWLRVQQMMKGSDIGIQEKKANQNGVDMLPLFIRPRICTLLITLNSPHQDQSSCNQNYLQQSMPNPEDITDPTTAMNMVLALMAKAFKLNYSTPTNNNQRISSNPKNGQIAQPEDVFTKYVVGLPQQIQTEMWRHTTKNIFEASSLAMVIELKNKSSSQKFKESSKGEEQLDKKEELFTLRIQVKQELIEAIVDMGSQKNLISAGLMQRLGLTATPHPRPYSLV
uniref:Ribonuclease H-like domain-containing protein n=1 Tax=Tanacetum cinerariifolium TaxID=118510 RepID=A0A6L2JK14_TANCI|nr:ribonuclease H-like domain-containing protein [Tanacetum cinerariifolium]